MRWEFAGAVGMPALGLYGTGSGTVLEHVQAHATLADGLVFSGGPAGCSRCVPSGSGPAGLA